MCKSLMDANHFINALPWMAVHLQCFPRPIPNALQPTKSAHFGYLCPRFHNDMISVCLLLKVGKSANGRGC